MSTSRRLRAADEHSAILVTREIYLPSDLTLGQLGSRATQESEKLLHDAEVIETEQTCGQMPHAVVTILLLYSREERSFHGVLGTCSAQSRMIYGCLNGS